jgi:polysaccharide pyruvyl transferase WcaK-like protein
MGYYGYGNLGDEMLLSAIRGLLAPRRVIAFSTGFQPTEDALERLNSFDYLILGGGGLFNRTPPKPFDTFDRWASTLHAPISVLGVGVEQLDKRAILATHSLVERADLFLVRDAESQRLIDHPKVQVAPDLTFFRPFSGAQLRQCAQIPVCGVNLRPLSRDMTGWIKAVLELPVRKVALPFSVAPAFDDRELLVQIASTPPCRQASLEDYEQLDLVVGMAFHSIVSAVQAGAPVVAINYHPKVRRLMEEMGLGSYVLECSEAERLLECCQSALAEQDIIRARMHDYTRRAQQTLIAMQSDLLSAIDVRKSGDGARCQAAADKPLVTVFVLCQNASDADVATTIASCSKQTYPKIQVVLVDCPDPSRLSWAEVAGGPPLRRAAREDYGSVEELFAISGELLTWMTAGAWYAEDAMSLLVRMLHLHRTAWLAHSNYFITSNGNIDRRVELLATTTEQSLPVGPCFLVRRESASKLWLAQDNSTGDVFTDGPIDRSAIHLSQALLYRPASTSERCLQLAAVAYGRGRTNEGKALLAKAIELTPDLAGRTEAFAQAFRLFLAESNNRFVTASPIEYLEQVCESLPSDNQRQRAYSRRFASQAYLELAFMYRELGQKTRVSISLAKAYRHNLRLLSNRGALWLLAEPVLGSSALTKLRKVKRRIERQQ